MAVADPDVGLAVIDQQARLLDHAEQQSALEVDQHDGEGDGGTSARNENLRAALSVARMIVVQERIASQQETADVAAMDSAIGTVVRDLALLDDITRIAGNAMTNCESIVTKATALKKRIEVQLDVLKDHVGGLVVHTRE